MPTDMAWVDAQNVPGVVPGPGNSPKPAPPTAPDGECEFLDIRGGRASEILDDEGLALEATIWDCPLILGMKDRDGSYPLESFDACVTIFLFACNVSIQIVFILAVQSTMAVTPLNKGARVGAAEQRLLQNHKYENLDLASLSTRTESLCAGGIFNSVSDLYSNIDTYISPDNTWLDFPIPGPVLAGLSMFVWVLSMTEEIRRSCELVLATFCLPTATYSAMSVDTREDCIFVRSMSAMRKVMLFGLVFLPRLFIAGWLLGYGLIYLADTLAVADMILNACALEIVHASSELLDQFTFPS